MCFRVRDIQATFHEFDKNHDGYVTIEEAKEAMHNLGVFNDDEIESLIFTYDTNRGWPTAVWGVCEVLECQVMDRWSCEGSSTSCSLCQLIAQCSSP